MGMEIPEDDKVVIGHSMVAYISNRDPSSIFLADAKWHDAATTSGSSIQKEWPWWKVNDEFHRKMNNRAIWEAENRPNLSEEERVALLYDLRLRAFELTILAEKYGKKLYEGKLM